MTSFAEKHVVVTGAGSGIGRATAIRFAREGARLVVVVDKDGDRARSASREVETLGAIADTVCVDLVDAMATTGAIDAVLERHKRIDVLISNAAAWTSEPFLSTTLEAWTRVLAVNVNASFILGQRVARSMQASGGGVILFTASISALGANRGFAPYCTSKGAIVSLMRSMAVELAPYGIRVNAVSPGPTDTQMGIEHLGEERMSRMRESLPVVPLGRLASPEDVAAAFMFLASDDASYISGHNLLVDGALTAQIYDAPD